MKPTPAQRPYYEHAGISIYHGDCREHRYWLTSDVLVSDPPYGVSFASGMGGFLGDCRVAGDASPELRDWDVERVGLEASGALFWFVEDREARECAAALDLG